MPPVKRQSTRARHLLPIHCWPAVGIAHFIGYRGIASCESSGSPLGEAPDMRERDRTVIDSAYAMMANRALVMLAGRHQKT
jgi:hypothetical protein